MQNTTGFPVLRDKIVLLTGATGGIGSATARRLAAAGAELILHAHTETVDLESLATELRQSGNLAGCLLADLSKEHGRQHFLEYLDRSFPQIDLFVQAAGCDLMSHSMHQLSFEERLEALWRLDVQATIMLARAIGQRMQRHGGGRIVLFGWNEVDCGMAGNTAELYAAAKGAVIGFMRSLAHSLAPTVSVNAISPGWIRTRWGENASEKMRDIGEEASLSQRWGEPDEVADAVLFLATATFVNGQNLHVDGGRL